jgi:hypothetical protein
LKGGRSLTEEKKEETKEEDEAVKKWRRLLARLADRDKSVIYVDLQDYIRPQLISGANEKIVKIAEAMSRVLSMGDCGIPNSANPLDDGYADEVMDILSILGQFGLDVLDGHEAYLDKAYQAVDKLTSLYV